MQAIYLVKMQAIYLVNLSYHNYTQGKYVEERFSYKCAEDVAEQIAATFGKGEILLSDSGIIMREMFSVSQLRKYLSRQIHGHNLYKNKTYIPVRLENGVKVWWFRYNYDDPNGCSHATIHEFPINGSKIDRYFEPFYIYWMEDSSGKVTRVDSIEKVIKIISQETKVDEKMVKNIKKKLEKADSWIEDENEPSWMVERTLYTPK